MVIHDVNTFSSRLRSIKTPQKWYKKGYSVPFSNGTIFGRTQDEVFPNIHTEYPITMTFQLHKHVTFLFLIWGRSKIGKPAHTHTHTNTQRQDKVPNSNK